jgi:hypothetical protein
MLPKLGFTKLVHLSKIYPRFPVDLFGEYNGRKCFIEVTTDHHVSPNEKRLGHPIKSKARIAQILGFDMYVLAFKQSFYRHREVDLWQFKHKKRIPICAIYENDKVMTASKCEHCLHIWLPKKPYAPKRCPRCREKLEAS